MPRCEVSAVIPASCDAVFDLVHDYDRRLSWDTLLSDARLLEGHTQAAKGVRSVCTGRPSLGRIAVETIYIAFDRPRLAAVEMVNHPPFFETWAASIRHADLGNGASRVVYTLHFTARPRWLRWALEPMMLIVFRWETRRRLEALRRWLAAEAQGPP